MLEAVRPIIEDLYLLVRNARCDWNSLSVDIGKGRLQVLEDFKDRVSRAVYEQMLNLIRFGPRAAFLRSRTSNGFGRRAAMISVFGSSPAIVRRCALNSSRRIAASCSRLVGWLIVTAFEFREFFSRPCRYVAGFSQPGQPRYDALTNS